MNANTHSPGRQRRQEIALWIAYALLCLVGLWIVLARPAEREPEDAATPVTIQQPALP